MSSTNSPVVAVAGAGEVGRSTLRHLLVALPDARFRVLDRDASALESALELAGDRAESRRAVIGSGDAQLLDGCALVVNTAGPFFGASNPVAEAAIAAGCRYVDICDDAEGIAALDALDERAHSAGVTLVTGAGFSPGLSNVLARKLVDEGDDIDAIDIAWLVREPDPGGLAALRHLLHMAVAPCALWRDGKPVEGEGFVPSTSVTRDFGDPVGSQLVFNTPHPEPVTLPRVLPQLRDVTCRGALMPAWANEVFSSISRLGFGGREEPRVVLSDGSAVDPVEVLWRVLVERHQLRGSDAGEGWAALLVSSLRDGETVGDYLLYDDAPMSRATGIGAAAVAAVAESADLPPGLCGAEALDPDEVLKVFTTVSESASAFPSGVLARAGVGAGG